MRRREQSIAAINYCPIRNATVSLLSATIGGAYYSSFILVSSVRALYQEAYPVSWVVQKLKARFIAEAGNRAVQGGNPAVIYSN
jgi:hypothetical protein